MQNNLNGSAECYSQAFQGMRTHLCHQVTITKNGQLSELMARGMALAANVQGDLSSWVY